MARLMCNWQFTNLRSNKTLGILCLLDQLKRTKQQKESVLMKIEIREPNKTGELTIDTFYANDRKGQQYKNFVKYYKTAKRANGKLRFYVDGTLEVIL